LLGDLDGCFVGKGDGNSLGDLDGCLVGETDGVIDDGIVEGVVDGEPEVSASPVNATLPALEPVPSSTGAIATESPRDKVPSPSPIVTAPPPVLPSPESRVIDTAPPTSEESPVLRLNVPALPLSEPVETALLAPEPEAVGPFPMFTPPPGPSAAEVEGLKVLSRSIASRVTFASLLNSTLIITPTSAIDSSSAPGRTSSVIVLLHFLSNIKTASAFPSVSSVIPS
jgi:hypothetical protein